MSEGRMKSFKHKGMDAAVSQRVMVCTPLPVYSHK